MKSCLIGLLSNTNCHENWYSRKPGLILLSSLSKSEIELVAFRSKTNLLNKDISSKLIYLHHYAYYITKFSKIVGKICCDIFEIHKYKKPKGSRIIILELAKLLISSSDAVAAQDFNQLINELKSKFQTTTSHSDQVQILTCKPA